MPKQSWADLLKVTDPTRWVVFYTFLPILNGASLHFDEKYAHLPWCGAYGDPLLQINAKNELHSSALDTGRTLLQPMFGALCYHHKVESEGLILRSKAPRALAPLLWDSRKPGVERRNPIAKVTNTLLSTSMSFRPDLKEFCDTKRAWCSCNIRLRSPAIQTWTISRGFWSRIIPQKFYSASYLLKISGHFFLFVH